MRIHLVTAAALTALLLPATAPAQPIAVVSPLYEYVYPTELTRGPDGSIWFAENFGNALGRVSPDGSMRDFPLPTSTTGPYGVVATRDGSIWFTEMWRAAVGVLNPDGTIVEYELPQWDSKPSVLCEGPDGNIWFVEVQGHRIGRITKKER